MWSFKLIGGIHRRLVVLAIFLDRFWVTSLSNVIEILFQDIIVPLHLKKSPLQLLVEVLEICVLFLVCSHLLLHFFNLLLHHEFLLELDALECALILSFPLLPSRLTVISDGVHW